MTEERIGIYAGKGVLPIKVAESITKSNKEVFIIAIKGLTDKNIEKFPHQWMRFGQIGLAMNLLKKNNCNELVIIGGARIPNFFFLFPDFFGLKLFFSLFKIRNKGDAEIIKTIINYIESKVKIKIVGAENFLKNILMSKGILTETNITKNNLNCIELGVKTCSKIGNNDIGQACIISNNEVIITEDINGTDYMLYRALKEKHNDISGGFLIKMLKPIQDPRVDLPTVGLNTLRLINELGLDGIILEDKKAFLVDKKKMIKYANQNNLFIYGI